MKLISLLTVLSTVYITVAIDVDCSMSDSTRCDCIYADVPNHKVTMSGLDCRVCRVEKQLMCVLWGSGGTRYGPLCEDKTCPEGKTWMDARNTTGGCYCDWGVKFHERMPCPTPAGDCKCSYVSYNGTKTSTVSLPGETCTVCPTRDAEQPYFCSETGNKKNTYGPLCMGNELGPQCTGKTGCVCNWMTTMDGVGWRNDTVQ